MLSFRSWVTVCFCVFLTASSYGRPVGRPYPDGKVTEIMRVESGGDFRCRISGKSLIAGAPLRVHIRGVGLLQDAGNAKAFLESSLSNGKDIRLTNLRLRNYFRVIADVQVDGNDLATELIKQGMVKGVKPPAINTGAIKQTVFSPVGTEKADQRKSRIRKTRTVRTSAATNLKVADSLKGMPIALGGDGFHPDMTFEEAIEQVRNSVDPPLPIIVLWPEIERNCFVNRDTPIGIKWNGQISIKKGLELLLLSVGNRSTSSLQYYVDGGIITIASSKAKLNKPVMRTYNIAGLALSPWMDRTQYGNGNQGGYGNGNNRNNSHRGNSGSSRGNRNNRSSSMRR